MDVAFKDTILAIVTTNREFVSNGTTPVFYARDDDERERVALLLSKVTMGMVHDLENGSYVIVKH